jgi:membrane-associated phospholipid phosphatase
LSSLSGRYAGIALSGVAILIAILWLDRPIATLSYDTFHRVTVVSGFTHAPSFFDVVTLLLLLVLIGRRLARTPFGKLDLVLILCELGQAGTRTAIASLKVLFGRTWPLYHHPSLILDGAYGFNFLRTGSAFESFPSGHMASIAALLGVFWICYPRYRRLYAVSLLSLAVALVVGDYHFLSDVLAGGLVGYLASVLFVSMFASGFGLSLRPGRA